MEHVKRQIQQGAGNAYYAGMQWRVLDVNYLGRYASTTLAAFELFLS